VVCDPLIGPCLQPSQPSDSSSSAAPSFLWTTRRTTTSFSLAPPSENLTLLDIPGTEELVFRRLDSGPRKGDLAVLNVHPLAGEPKTILATPANLPTTEDYAVVSLLPGLDPSLHPDSWGELHLWHTGRGRVCLPGGLCEGTATAAEVAKVTELTPFEALLHVKIAHGVPVMTDLVSVRNRSN
jgi:hypothetical protein